MEPDSFAIDVIHHLHSQNLESANKVAYDFQGAWYSRLTSTNKTSVIEICTKMHERRFPTKPYYDHFFNLITYALTQESVSDQQFTTLLEILHYTVDNYEKQDVSNMFRTLMYFFARGYIYHSHYNKLTTEGGSFSIELLEEIIPIKSDALSEEVVVEEDDEFISDDEELRKVAQEVSDDGWGDSSDDDGWGSDPWVAEDDGYIKTAEEKKEYVRPVYVEVKQDLVSRLQSNDIDPPIGGPVLKIKGMNFKMSSPYDTINISNASGTFIIKDQVFVGTSGVIDWPDDFEGTDGVIIDLNKYSFDTRQPILKTSRAKMVFPQMFKDSIPGAFNFKSGRRNVKDKRTYPRFTSLYSDIELNLPGDNVKYVGGFGIMGDQMFGASVSEIPSTLDVVAKNERSFRSKSKMYLFKDSLITAEKSSLVLYHNKTDSIYHPMVRMKYDIGKSFLTIQKDDGDFKDTFFYSSFFRMEFKADLIRWDLEADSLDVSILNARNMIPALFESEDYFNPIRFKKMSGIFGFHPIMVVVQYARKVQSSSFNILELQFAFKLDEKRTRSAIHYLEQNGYITFNKETGNIKVLRKSFHYIMSSFAQKDYDNFLVSSVSPNAPNASLNFVTKEMDVRGVKRVYITPDQEVYFEPLDNVLTLLEGKSMKFNGMVNAGDFQYKGHDFIFNYNAYLVEMTAIDSIRIQIAFEESAPGEEKKRTALDSHLETTSGTLFINDPKNKAGLKNYVQYPYFVSDSEAIVYFDSPKILGGAYDRSVYFIIPPFKSDTVGQGDPDALSFEGTFYSGNILQPIKESLHIMPDKSMGFEHTVPESGYNLYQGSGKIYNKIFLDNGGLQGDGKIDYRTAEVASNDFKFYMDSVAAEGVDGFIKEGKMGNATYPQADLTNFKMRWLPLKDSMYIENKKDPFQFYNSTASLNGKANITSKGVFGSGTMLSRGSKSKSNEYHFEIDKYSGRHSQFEILTADVKKPAMAGKDIYFQFDLNKNEVDIHPEVAGVAAISFPYSQMNTSITRATWLLDSALVEMHKPDNVPIEYSYFYSTKPNLDSLAFNASSAVYDIKTSQLHIYGIPYIRVADAEVIPENNRTTILENSVLLPFQNAKLKIDTLNGYHNLYDGHITVISRKKFEGYATYRLINADKDTFAIKFEKFELQNVPTIKGATKQMTVSGGSITEPEQVKVSPGFLYKGDVTMYADRLSLKKDGYVALDIPSRKPNDYWISYYSDGEIANVQIDIEHSQTELGEPAVAGLLYNKALNGLYMSFVSPKKSPEDKYFFKSKGNLTFDNGKREYRIEEPIKTNDKTYIGKSMVYNVAKNTLAFEGPVQFIENKEKYKLEASIVAKYDLTTNEINANSMISMNMAMHPSLIDVFTFEMMDVIERIGHEVAHKNEFDFLVNLSSFIGEQATRTYENKTLRGYTPLVETSPLLDKTLFISNVDLKWTDKYQHWYSTSKIGLSNIRKTDINAEMEGFLEIGKSEDGEDLVHLFIQPAPSVWYYFAYDQGRLLMFSSNDAFNNLVAQYSEIAKTGFGEYTIVIGDQFDVLTFIEEFRLKYYGISEDYNLELPEVSHIKSDEKFNTIEKREDSNDTATEPEKEAEPFEEPTVGEDDGF